MLNLTYCLIYLDDIIVFGWMEEEHLEHLCVVFSSFREFNLKFKSPECSFFQLAHHVSQEGIFPSRDNVHAIEDFLMPETFTQVDAFCNLAGHYTHFIKGFACMAKPLYDVLGKEVKMDPVQLPPKVWEVVRVMKDKTSIGLPRNLISHFSWKLTLPRKGWEQCCLKSKTMGAIIPSPLGATP